MGFQVFNVAGAAAMHALSTVVLARNGVRQDRAGVAVQGAHAAMKTHGDSRFVRQGGQVRNALCCLLLQFCCGILGP
jgi:hypothetical protein